MVQLVGYVAVHHSGAVTRYYTGHECRTSHPGCLFYGGACRRASEHADADLARWRKQHPDTGYTAAATAWVHSDNTRRVMLILPQPQICTPGLALAAHRVACDAIRADLDNAAYSTIASDVVMHPHFGSDTEGGQEFFVEMEPDLGLRLLVTQ